jgi:hypothetical protein
MFTVEFKRVESAERSRLNARSRESIESHKVQAQCNHSPVLCFEKVRHIAAHRKTWQHWEIISRCSQGANP